MGLVLSLLRGKSPELGLSRHQDEGPGQEPDMQAPQFWTPCPQNHEKEMPAICVIPPTLRPPWCSVTAALARMGSLWICWPRSERFTDDTFDLFLNLELTRSKCAIQACGALLVIPAKVLSNIRRWGPHPNSWLICEMASCPHPQGIPKEMLTHKLDFPETRWDTFAQLILTY